MATRSLVRSGLVNFAETRSMLVGNAIFVLPSYELVETYILDSNQDSVTFSNLDTYSSTYKHLQIRWSARSTRTGLSTDAMKLTYNNNENNFTNSHSFGGDASVVISAFENQPRIAVFSASEATENAFGAGVIDFLDIYGTKNKTARSFSGQADPSVGFAGSRIFVVSNLWASSESITSISLGSLTANGFVSGSRFSLYGIRG
jgi:hypothetical protein